MVICVVSNFNWQIKQAVWYENSRTGIDWCFELLGTLSALVVPLQWDSCLNLSATSSFSDIMQNGNMIKSDDIPKMVETTVHVFLDIFM